MNSIILENKKVVLLNAFFLGYSIVTYALFLLLKTDTWLLSGYEGIPAGMMWNLFLAYIAYNSVVLLVHFKNKWLRVMTAVVAFLFYPNTFYLLTDAKHIGDWFPNPRSFNFGETKETVYYMILMLAVMLGILIGVETMLLFLKHSISQWRYKVGFVLLMSFLSSVAIYAGRISDEAIRLNSWDLLARPLHALEILFKVIHPDQFVFLASFTVFQIFMIGLGFVLSLEK